MPRVTVPNADPEEALHRLALASSRLTGIAETTINGDRFSITVAPPWSFDWLDWAEFISPRFSGRARRANGATVLVARPSWGWPTGFLVLTVLLALTVVLALRDGGWGWAAFLAFDLVVAAVAYRGYARGVQAVLDSVPDEELPARAHSVGS